MVYKLEFFCPDCDYEYGDGGWLQVITKNICPNCGSFNEPIAYSTERSWGGKVKDKKLCPDGLRYKWNFILKTWQRKGSPKYNITPFAIELAKLLEIEADGEESSFVQHCLEDAFDNLYGKKTS